jgi:hypothetical protein
MTFRVLSPEFDGRFDEIAIEVQIAEQVAPSRAVPGKSAPQQAQLVSAEQLD